MHQFGPTNYVLRAVIFAAVLASASATKAGEPVKGASDAAALVTPDNFAKIMAHMEATNTDGMNPEGIMRQMDLLHVRCDPCNLASHGSAMPHRKPMHEAVLGKPTHGALSIKNEVMHNK